MAVGMNSNMKKFGALLMLMSAVGTTTTTSAMKLLRTRSKLTTRTKMVNEEILGYKLNVGGMLTETTPNFSVNPSDLFVQLLVNDRDEMERDEREKEIKEEYKDDDDAYMQSRYDRRASWSLYDQMLPMLQNGLGKLAGVRHLDGSMKYYSPAVLDLPTSYKEFLNDDGPYIENFGIGSIVRFRSEDSLKSVLDKKKILGANGIYFGDGRIAVNVQGKKDIYILDLGKNVENWNDDIKSSLIEFSAPVNRETAEKVVELVLAYKFRGEGEQGYNRALRNFYSSMKLREENLRYKESTQYDSETGLNLYHIGISDKNNSVVYTNWKPTGETTEEGNSILDIFEICNVNAEFVTPISRDLSRKEKGRTEEIDSSEEGILSENWIANFYLIAGLNDVSLGENFVTFSR